MERTEEQRLIEHVEHRLRTRFPQVPAEEVRRVVADVLQRYDGSRVRDFVPLLVEREARDALGGSVLASPAPAREVARTEAG